MINKTINYIIEQKDCLNEYIDELIYSGINDNNSHYKPLTENTIKLIEELRKQIFDCYKIIDILNEKGENK